MSKKMLVLPLMFISCVLFAQTGDTARNSATAADTTVYTKVDMQAEFPGGRAGWLNFVQHNLNASVPVDNGAKKGKYVVWVKFVVTREGHVKNLAAETKMGYGLEAEVLRMMSLSPDWIPAKLSGKPVNSYMRISQPFEVSEG